MQRSEYSAFGVLVGRTTASSFDDIGGQPFGFAGGLFDPITGLTLFGARDYDPRLGRWLARDPLGFGAGDTNLFAYVGGDPVNLVDPTGLMWGEWDPGPGHGIAPGDGMPTTPGAGSAAMIGALAVGALITSAPAISSWYARGAGQDALWRSLSLFQKYLWELGQMTTNTPILQGLHPLQRGMLIHESIGWRAAFQTHWPSMLETMSTGPTAGGRWLLGMVARLLGAGVAVSGSEECE